MNTADRIGEEEHMNIAGRVIVVTGAASGIGKGLAEGFHKAGAKAVVAADLDLGGASSVAQAIGGDAFACDVGQEADIQHLVEETERRHGPIDLFCSNAGIGGASDMTAENVAFATNEIWQRAWSVNVMAHVFAARALIPRMRARGGGYFLNTVSAAGLLSQVGNAVYSTTKHAAVGFAESLAIAHKADGIRVSILCPQGVDTPMLRASSSGPQWADGVLTPEAVADCVIEALARETFLILPHAQVASYMQRKVENYDRWIGGMAKMQRAYREEARGSR
jgi:NAD(P)-dependent dehydrogenase (short-subunit alcohol dehydrogenase family)